MYHMSFKISHTTLMIFPAMLSVCACVEPFDVETQNYESVLVVEATITDELKSQDIILSRAYRLDGDASLPENNAEVSVIENDGREYQFNETEPGKYTSAEMFAAKTGSDYRLVVSTSDGRSYSSDTAQSEISNSDTIDSLYALRTTDKSGTDGVEVYIDNANSNTNARFYRYEYEETYKFVAPFWVSNDLVETPEGSSRLELIPKIREEQTCYRSEKLNTILLGSTNAFQENRLTRFPILFIENGSYSLRYRYSVLVRQFIISQAAYTFYETLRDFSGNESIFSENQPGFFAGNIISETDRNEKVVGFFDVSSVSSKRIYFNHKEIFPELPFPVFQANCTPEAPRFDVLIDQIRSGNVKYVSGSDEGDGPYNVVPDLCGDCTVLGSNEVPDFWEEQ